MKRHLVFLAGAFALGLGAGCSSTSGRPETPTAGDRDHAGAAGEAGDLGRSAEGAQPSASAPDTPSAQPSSGSSLPPGDSTPPGAAKEAPARDAASDPPRVTSVRSFIFGHSLLVHEPEKRVPGPLETAVPYWMLALAQHDGYSYAAAGQYGFLRSHSKLPPIAQWAWPSSPSPWDSDRAPFSAGRFDNVLLTAANFIQYKPPGAAYDGDNPGKATPLGETLKIVDWVRKQNPEMDIYIYEGWPEMTSGFPPNASQLAAYYDTTRGSFHDWWTTYQDRLRAARPAANVRMIPAGPAIARVLTTAPFDRIPVAKLYEDNAPHGRPTLYLLAAMATYMGTYGTKISPGFEPTQSVDPILRNHFDAAVDLIWQELNASKDAHGNSRVW